VTPRLPEPIGRPTSSRGRRWYAPLMFGLSVVTGAIGLALFIVAGFQHDWSRVLFDDLLIYRDATRRLLSGGSWYLEHQVTGQYSITHGDVLYPPVAAWFFAPWLVLPPWTFTAIPAALLLWWVARTRPRPWAWPLLTLAATYPITLLYVVFANPSIWAAAFVAMGLRYGWPGVLVLLKPSLAPFAAVGMWTRGWWIALALLAAACLPVLGPTLEYPRVVLNGKGGGLLYSLASLPVMLLPLIAWAASTQRIIPDKPDVEPETTS
jgi:hypothetical protein